MNIFNLHMNASSSLTSTQRWDAIRLLNSDLWTKDGFIFVCGIVLAILVILFVIVNLLDAIKRKKVSNSLFIEYADKRGLSLRERQILMDIANKSRLKLAESIFDMADVFDRGATQMIRVTLAKHGAKQSRCLSAELSMLREKMGFRKRIPVSEAEIQKDVQGSRQIPEGKKIYLTNTEAIEFVEVETEVIENSNLGLSVNLKEKIECEVGDAFCARCYLGSVIWEFDTYIQRINGNVLILQHNENIRYVNRRRFLRVPVKEPAYIAAFPFAKNIPDIETSNIKTDIKSQLSGSVWEPPEFVSADLIELAGPGLRLISPIEVKIGDRVIVILKLRHLINKNSNYANDNSRHSKIIENVGIVKHIEKAEKGFSIAVELSNLSESNISEMVRATNEASMNKKRIMDISSEHKEKAKKYEYVSETIVG